MDELDSYLIRNKKYSLSVIKNILDTKHVIHDTHIKNTKYEFFMDRCVDLINNNLFTITLYKQYGYVFSCDIYKYIMKRNAYAFKYIDDIDKTDELCEYAVSMNGSLLEYVPTYKKTNHLYKLAIKNSMYCFDYIIPEHVTPELILLNIRTYRKEITYDRNVEYYAKCPDITTINNIDYFDLIVEELLRLGCIKYSYIPMAKRNNKYLYIYYKYYLINKIRHTCDKSVDIFYYVYYNIIKKIMKYIIYIIYIIKYE